MKLRDFFLPKLAHSDPAVRKEAVLSEKDAQMLEKVIEHDDSREVRQAAKMRLNELQAST